MTLTADWRHIFNRRYFTDALDIARLSMRDQYRNSLLGMTWSLVQPVMQIAIMTVVFSVLLRIQMDSYIVYVVSGVLPWQFMVNAVTRGASAICNRRHIFNHTSLSKTMFVLADVLTQMYTFFITIGVALIISLVEKGGSPVLLTLPVVLLPLLITVFSAAVLFAYVSAYIWDTPHVLGILFQSLIWTVPIMYPLAMIPEKYQLLFKLNPLYALISPIQSVLYYHQLPEMFLFLEAWGTAVLVSAVAYMIYRKLRSHVIYYI